MIPLFSATNTLPSAAKRTATGLVRPSIAMVSMNPGAGVEGVDVVEEVLPSVGPLVSPSKRGGGLSGAGEAGGFVGSAAREGGTTDTTDSAAMSTSARPSPANPRCGRPALMPSHLRRGQRYGRRTGPCREDVARAASTP